MFTWASNRKPAVLSTQPPATLWHFGHKRIHLYRRTSSDRMGSEQPGPARDMPLRQGRILRPSAKETIELRWCPVYRGYQGTIRRANGRSWQQTSQALTTWNVPDVGGTATRQGVAK